MKGIASAVLVMSCVFAAGCSSMPRSDNGPSSPTPVAVSSTAATNVDRRANVGFSNSSKELPADWQWLDPNQKHGPTPYEITNGALRIRVPTGKDLYGENTSAPRYVKAIKGDFQIETRVRFRPKGDYQGAGLLIYKDAENYIRFERAFGGLGGGADGIRLDVRKGAEHTPIVTPGEIETEADEVELKIVRTGRLFTAFWRVDEEGEWREAGEVESDYPDTILAGLIACNTAREITAEFSYVRLLPALKR